MLLVLCVCALGGLLVGELTRLDRFALSAVIVCAGLGAALVRQRPGWRLLALACCAAALGALRAELHRPPDSDPLRDFTNVPVQLRGRVETTPQRTERSIRFILSVSHVGQAPIDNARVLLVADPLEQGAQCVGLGDVVEARGRLGEPDNASGALRAMVFPRLTLLERGGTEPLALLARLRAAAVAAIQDALPEPHASLTAGVLLGGSGRLSPEFKQQLERSGLAHIVAIDGFKQIMVTAALGAIAVRLIGRPWAAAPIVLGVLGYTLLTGARPSAIRAGLMVGMATLAGIVGRVPDSLTSLLLAATLMVGFDPHVVRDIGFQLSFSATLGLILLWPQLRRSLRGVPDYVAEPAGVTVAVTLATLPVMLSVFQSVSLISPLAHVVGMPLLPPVLLVGALLVLSAPLPPLQHAIAWVGWLPTTLLVETVRIAGSLPAAALTTGRLPLGAANALAVALLVWGVWHVPELAALRRLAHRAWHDQPGWHAPALVAASALIGLSTMLLVRPDGRVHVEVLAVAPGQAILIRGPTGRTALVAAGRVDARALASQVSDRLAVWEHGLHAAIDLDPDAAARLELTLERYPAQERLDGSHDGRVDLGGGAAVDLYARSPTLPGVAVSFGRTWVRILGQPPPPLSAADGEAPIIVSADDDLVLEMAGRSLRRDT
jgi:competence protein ComEC